MSDPAYFEAIAASLAGAGIARPAIVLDLDAVDHNTALLLQAPGAAKLRIVTKSLPSRELVKYLLGQTGTRRLMAFHAPYLLWMLSELPDVDILMGKPFLPGVLQEMAARTGVEGTQALARQVQWLVDTPQRLDEHAAFARRHGVELRINIEIDVGLHRGGAADVSSLDVLLDGIDTQSDALGFAGFMGYEAHVPFMPQPDTAFERSLSTYAEMVAFAESKYAHLIEATPTWNSGGSKTCWRFRADDSGSVVNDVAAGSAFVKPSTFEILSDYRPALFIATPVIRKFARVSRRELDPAQSTALYLYGGGWAAELVHPAEVVSGPGGDPPNQNLLPNQSLFLAPGATKVEIGDYVFFVPHQGDAMFQFEDIHVLRGGSIIDTWKPFPLRY
ncbi:MAG: alanine racemase [Pseudomonadales bacterium]|nr:alanine racemase [Pseudomonadales bacterium]